MAAGTCTPQILVSLVDNGLGIGDVVNRCHAPVDDADLLVHDLDHRCKAVGGTRGGRDQMMYVGIVQVMIDAIDDIQRAFGRCCHHDFFYALIEVGLQTGRLLMVSAGRLDHDIAARPIGVGNGSIAAVCHRAAFELHRVSCRIAGHRPDAVDRIELQQMRRSCRVGRDLVDLNNLEYAATPACTQTEPAHAPETVDTHPNRHIENP